MTREEAQQKLSDSGAFTDPEITAILEVLYGDDTNRLSTNVVPGDPPPQGNGGH